MRRYGQAVTDLLGDPAAGDVQRLLGDALDHAYPSTSSGTGGSNHSNPVDENGRPDKPPTTVERSVIQPDRAAVEALRILDALRQWHELSIYLYGAISNWHPARPVAMCPRCGHPFDRGYTRCQQIIDGKQCGSTERTETNCTKCDRKLEAGARRSNYGECQPCYRQRINARHRVNGASQ